MDQEYNSVLKEVWSDRFDFDKPLPERPEYLFEVTTNGKSHGIALPGSLVAFSGKQKSRKSSMAGAFVSAALCPSCNILNINVHESLKDKAIMYFDTERSPLEFSYGMRSIYRQAGLENNTSRLIALPVRKHPYKQYDIVMSMVESVAKKRDIGLIVLDGILDAFVSYMPRGDNEANVTDKFVKSILALGDQYGCPLLAPVHQNKSDTNISGHLGSAILKKMSYNISFDKQEDGSTLVQAKDARMGEEFDDFLITHEDGRIKLLEGSITDSIFSDNSDMKPSDLPVF